MAAREARIKQKVQREVQHFELDIEAWIKG